MLDSVLKGIKDAVWEDEAKKREPAPAPAGAVKSTPSFASTFENFTVKSESSAAAYTQEDVESLRKMLPASSSQASAQFERSVDSLAAVIPDEDTRVKATITMLTSQGVSLQAIVDDYVQRLGAIEKHLEQFKIAKDKKLSAEVAGPLEFIDGINKKIAEAQNLITSLLAQRDQIEVQTNNAKQEIETKTARITGAANALAEEIKERIRKLKSRI